MNMELAYIAGFLALAVITIYGMRGVLQLSKDGSTEEDLRDFTEWLSEKGALREGFGIGHLVKDYMRDA